MTRSRRTVGFTIVELLITVVIIGILALIVVVTFSNIRQQAINQKLSQEIHAWSRAYELYKANNGEYPYVPDGGYCLGYNFPNQRCRNYKQMGANTYYESSSTGLMDEMKLVNGSVPDGSIREAPPAGVIGPYVVYHTHTGDPTKGTIILRSAIFGAETELCEKYGMQLNWSNGTDSSICEIVLKRGQ